MLLLLAYEGSGWDTLRGGAEDASWATFSKDNTNIVQEEIIMDIQVVKEYEK